MRRLLVGISSAVSLLGIPAMAWADEIPFSGPSSQMAETQAVDMADPKDTDADGLPDVWEIHVFKTDPQKADTDGDGFTDFAEIRDFYDPLAKAKALAATDLDGDGLEDRLEFLFKTDPFAPDTDGDGFSDGKEIAAGFSPTSTTDVPLKKRINISLSKQTMKQELGGVVLANFRVSTGKPGMATPTGDFKVLEKSPKAWSSSAKLWMPYWMKFTNRGHGIHELPEWPGGKKEGMDHLGKPVSHGCVRLGIGPAKTMYAWADIGTPIHIER